MKEITPDKVRRLLARDSVMSDVALKQLSKEELKEYLYSLTRHELEGLLDGELRHRSSAEPSDYLERWLLFSRPFTVATEDDSWGELEKRLTLILRSYIMYRWTLAHRS